MTASLKAEFATTPTSCADSETQLIAPDAKLKVELTPYIENRTFMKVEQLISVTQQMTAANSDGNIIEPQQLVGTMKTSTQQVVDEVKPKAKRAESALSQQHATVANIGDKLKGIENRFNDVNDQMTRDNSTYETGYAATQSQLAVAHSLTSAGSAISQEPRSSEPQATRKLMISKDELRAKSQTRNKMNGLQTKMTCITFYHARSSQNIGRSRSFTNPA